MIDLQLLSVFIGVFLLVVVLGVILARRQSGDLSRLQEWGLAGRRFGTVISWFLIGGDVYTAYTFIAVPGLILGGGASGFFAVPYTILVYPIFLIVLPRFWTVARHRGYVTSADFVQERFGSRLLTLGVALTGILATMPYIALQMYGIEVVLSLMGFPVEGSLLIAFLILAVSTYVSGLRAPAMMALAKDLMIFLVIGVTFVVLLRQWGDFTPLFAAVHDKAASSPKTFSEILTPGQYPSYVTLAIGSALALFLYPHSLTGIFSTNSRKVLRRNAALLLFYTLLLASIGLLGYAALAMKVKLSPVYQANSALPALFAQIFPPWFTGFAFAAIAIGALVPVAIMSIAAANLFTRNIYREFFRPACTEREETSMARGVSLVVKFGALAFIVFFPNTFSINFQLLGGVWILQTLPAVFLGLYTNWFHRRALFVGLASGMVLGTLLAFSQNFKSIFPLSIAGTTIPVYAGLIALVINLVCSVALTPIFNALGVSDGQDETTPSDFEIHPVEDALPLTQPRYTPVARHTQDLNARHDSLV